MSRRGLIAGVVGVVVLVAAVAFGLGQTRGVDTASDDPHAGVGRLDERRLDRVLNAVEGESTATDQAALTAEGRRLFRSSELARQGESCQSCHTEGGGVNPDLGTIMHPQGSGDFRGPRDVSSLWGVGRTAPYGWDGRTPGLEEFVVGTIESHFADGASQPVAETGRQAAAITAYLRTLEPPVTDFDQGTLSPAALRGEDLFQGKGGCMACHGGPLLTDNAVHNTLVPKVLPTDTDWGTARTGALRNSFNTPHLRDLRATAPYMHNGSLKTLRDVVEFYDDDSSVAPLNLTPTEIDDLVVYLQSL
jgi:cytochrome c peroxidase